MSSGLPQVRHILTGDLVFCGRRLMKNLTVEALLAGAYEAI